MDTKKATIITIIVITIAILAMTVVIAWLGTNLPGTQDTGLIEDYIPHPYPPTETYNYPSTQEETEPPEPYYPTTESYEPGGDEYYPYETYDYYPQEEEEEEEAEIFTPIFTSEPLPEHIIQQITGVTFHETTPFGHDYLTYLTVTHVNFEGESVLGHLIVAANIGYEVLDIFREIYEGGFPIHSIRLIDYFDASDYLSMAANNSHAFNFRYIAGTNTISRHGFGVAIDINPIQNPYIRSDTVWPAAGVDYIDRTNVRPGMIIPGDVVYTAFLSRGWTWGGYWTWPRDYHHFERRR